MTSFMRKPLKGSDDKKTLFTFLNNNKNCIENLPQRFPWLKMSPRSVYEEQLKNKKRDIFCEKEGEKNACREFFNSDTFCCFSIPVFDSRHPSLLISEFGGIPYSFSCHPRVS